MIIMTMTMTDKRMTNSPIALRLGTNAKFTESAKTRTANSKQFPATTIKHEQKASHGGKIAGKPREFLLLEHDT